MRREPEVPEEKDPVVECLGGHARITTKELAINSFCAKWHPPECLFYKTKSGCKFGEMCSYAHRQVDEQPTKRSTKNDDKSAVAMLKKGDLHESVRELVVNLDECHDRSGRNLVRGRDQEIGTKMHLNFNLLTHGNWVAYFRTWRRRSLFSGRAQTCRDQSNVWRFIEGYCASH